MTAPSIPTLWIFAHEDDETLCAGVPMAEHVAAGRIPNCLIMTDGATSNVLGALNGETLSTYWKVMHNPAAEGYDPLTPDVFSRARRRETRTALDAIATPHEIPLYAAGYPSDVLTVEQVKTEIRTVADQIDPTGGPVQLKGHTYLAEMEAHRDHLAVGNAIRELAAEEPRFATPRYYVLSAYWKNTPPAGHTMVWDMPTNADIAARAVNAGRAYSAWAPPDAYAIGIHSTASLFATLAATPKSMFHV